MVAVVVVSASELQTVISNWTESYPLNNPKSFRNILWGMGIDVNTPVDHQTGLTHRNRLNAVVTCDRWVAKERTDEEWLNSGFASREARNDASGSKLVRDLDPHRFHQI